METLRRWWSCAALALAVAAATGAAQSNDPTAAAADGAGVGLLRVQFASSSSEGGASERQTELFTVAVASFGTPLAAPSALLLLRVVRGGTGDCGLPVDSQVQQQLVGSAVVVERGAGGCSFVRQALAAQRAGAALVVVRDSIVGALAAAPASAFDCALGAGFVDSNASFPLVAADEQQDEDEEAACARTPTCLSEACVPTGRRIGDDPARFQVCCFRSHLLRMSVDSDAQHLALAAAVRIPAVFLAYRDAERLERSLLQLAANASTSVPLLALAQAFSADESPWNLSMPLMWLLGVGVVVSAAYGSCSHERAFSYAKVASAFASYTLGDGSRDDKSVVYGSETELTVEEAEWGYVPIEAYGEGIDDDSDERPHDDARLALTGRHAILLVVGASASLMLLYYVHDVMLLVNVLFAVGASNALALVMFTPLASALLPTSWSVGSNKALAVSGALGLAVGMFWFVERSSASIWPLQNLLGIALCFLFVDTIHLPSLRVGAILLGVAFVYDVFFVYFSPFVFGSNVMVDVASGGGNARVVYDDPAVLQLSQQLGGPDQAPSQPRYETAPMVLSIPLLFSHYTGNALLGLGDVMLPSLLVAFCIRYDYCMGHPLSRGYFCVASVAYAVGLLLAMVMAVVLRNVVAGQPALMYIVPLLLASVLGAAKLNGELETMWSGPPCLQMDAGVKTDAGRSRGETQPLVAATP